MPYLKLSTNQPLRKDQCEALKKGFAEALAPMGKSESWVMVEFAPEVPLYFGGIDAPAAMLSMDLLGQPGDDAYGAFAAAATALVTEATGAPAERVFLKFSEHTRWGWNGGLL